MRALTSEVVAVIFAVSIPAVAMAQGPFEAPMVAIEGGSYPIGSADGPASTGPVHRVTLDSFLIDVYEVTNAQFATFLNTLEVTAKRDVRAGELRPDDTEGPDANRLWGGSSGNDRAFTTVSTGPFTIDEVALMVEENMVTKDEFKRLEDKVESGFAILDRKLDHFLGVVRGDYDQLATRVKRLEDTIFRA